MPPKKGASHVWRLIKEVFTYEPRDPATSLNEVLTYLNRVVTRHAIVFLISDCMDHGFDRSLRLTARKHDLSVIRVSDPAERELPDVGLMHLRDPETGRTVLVNTGSRALRRKWRAYRREQGEYLSGLFKSCGVGCGRAFHGRTRGGAAAAALRVETEEDVNAVLHHRAGMWFGRRVWVLLLLMALKTAAGTPAAAHGAPPPAEAGLAVSVDRDSAPVGGIVSLTLSYTLPDGASLPDEPEIKGLEGLTVIGRAGSEGALVLRVLVDRLGSWRTGPLILTYLDREGERASLEAAPVSVTVLSNLGEKPAEAELKPILDIIPVTAGWVRTAAWVAGAVGLLLLVSALWWWRRRRRIRDVTAVVHDPPHVRAFRELGELQALGLFEKGRVKPYYFRFSEIVRRYLEDIRGFPAAEYTTQEIASRVNNDTDRALIPLLRQADMVKFADAVPTVARKEEDVEKALAYIRDTGPAVEQEEGGLATHRRET